MSFAEGITVASFDLADPTFVLYACIALIFVCVVLDLPAIAGAFRLLRLRRRLGKSGRTPSASEQA